MLRSCPNRWRRGATPPLAYACHLRDVCRVYTERLALMSTQDDPHHPNWDQDATAVEDRYLVHDPVHHLWDVTGMKAAIEVL